MRKVQKPRADSGPKTWGHILALSVGRPLNPSEPRFPPFLPPGAVVLRIQGRKYEMTTASAHEGRVTRMSPARAGNEWRQGAGPQEVSPGLASGFHAGAADVTVTTATTDPILITLTRPEVPAPWGAVSATWEGVTPQQSEASSGR